MQRVSAFLPTWEKRNSSASTGASSNKSRLSGTGSTGGNGGLFAWPHRSSSRSSTISVGANSLHKPAKQGNGNARVQKEAFWPATLEEECDKAARILKSFCGDGYLAPLSNDSAATSPSTAEPTTPTKVMKRIPRRILQNAAGIAIFTCMRSGLWMTGSGGSGILIARKSDGTWSPPSGIMLHTPTLSFVMGVDVYDCILVISDLAALEAIIRPRVTLGEDVALAAGQSVAFDSQDSDFKWTDPGATVLTYLKARGQHQHVNLSGCMLTERANENERFYGSEVSQMDILAGNVGRSVEETRPLFEVIKMAEGRTDYDSSIIRQISATAAPGDAMIASPKSKQASSGLSFGVPDMQDPDPFGILALEMAGLEIREAGSHARPTSSQLNFNSSLSSPMTSKFPRQSVDTFLTRSNRGSSMSTHTVKSQTSDAGTQTAEASPETSPTRGVNEVDVPAKSSDQADRKPGVPEEQPESVDYTTIDTTPIKHISSPPSIHSATSVDLDSSGTQPKRSNDDADKESKASSVYDKNSDSDDLSGTDDDDDDLSDEEPVIFEVAAVQPTRPQQVAARAMQVKGSMVTIPKRLPPPLPMRNPGRRSRLGNNDMGGETASLRSPLRHEFGDSALDVPQSDGDRSRRTSSDSYDDKQRLSIEKPEAQQESLRLNVPSPEMHEKADVEENTPTLATKEVPSMRRESASEDKDASTNMAPDANDDQARLVDEKQAEVDDEKAPSIAYSRTSTDTSGSISGEKQASSIFTGSTEGRGSFDASSVTTPTSERPFSAIGDAATDDTPRKPSKAEPELDATTPVA